MSREIDEQPAVLARLLARRAAFDALARTIRSRAPRQVLLVARGSSDHAAVYAKYLFEIRLGLPTALFSPSVFTIYDATLTLDDALVVAVSQSGASPDVVEPIARARRSGARTLAITNDAGSPLAEAAELVLDLEAGEERAVAATKTYTAELLAVFLLVEAMAGRDAHEANALPDEARRVLDEERGTALAARYRDVDQLVTTARGYAYTTALETALKLMETSYVVAHAFSGADLLHGPLAMIDAARPTIAIVPRGPGGDAMRPVIARLRERGADVAVVGAPEAASLGDVAVPIDVDVAEVVAPILTILPLQRLALALARLRGIDPDAPRAIAKVTRTS